MPSAVMTSVDAVMGAMQDRPLFTTVIGADTDGTRPSGVFLLTNNMYSPAGTTLWLLGMVRVILLPGPLFDVELNRTLITIDYVGHHCASDQ